MLFTARSPRKNRKNSIMLDRFLAVVLNGIRNISEISVMCCQKTPTLLAIIIVNTLDDGELAGSGELVGHPR